MKNINFKNLIVWCFIAIFFFCQYPAVSLMAKNTSDDRKTAEAEDFIKELYEAESNRDVKWIRERLEDDAVEDWATRLGTLYFDDLGFQKYNNVEVIAYPTSDENYFVACVAYDMIVEWNGENLSLPGFVMILLKQTRNSHWSIPSGNVLAGDLVEEMRQLRSSDEIVEMSNAVSREYYDALTDTPELSNWLAGINDQIYHWIGSWLALEICREKGAWDYLFGEKDGLLTTSWNGESDSIYIVQKGDCLWSIAKQELGDGMYWVKLYEANRDVIGENPDLLWVGLELDIIQPSSIQ